MTPTGEPADAWSAYVAGFHRDHPGITEALLSRALDDGGRTPYDWIGASVAGRWPVVDVGCGSGPTRALVAGWVGIDVSRAELRQAQSLGRGPLVTATALALPLPAGSVSSVIAAMSLMVMTDPLATLAEVSRALRSGGQLAVLVPANGPLGTADLIRYALLLALLGRRSLPFPRPDVVHDPRALIEAAGFTITSDERRRFGFRVPGRRGADLLVGSLYLPGVAAGRIRAARWAARRWGTIEIGIPLRLIVARVDGDRAGGP